MAFPTPARGVRLAQAERWVDFHIQKLQNEGYGLAVIETVRPMLRLYATTGEGGHLDLANRLLKADR